MDESAITPEPIRKRAKIGNKCDASTVDPTTAFPNAGIVFLPVEIISEILSYLSYKDLCATRRVSRFFERIVCDPFLWRTYEVTDNEQDTVEVIKELKRMPLLKRFSIRGRKDCEHILRQLSLTNKELEELYIFGCTRDGRSPAVCTKSELYLRSSNLIRILKGCRNLHTINIDWNCFRGQNLYRLLGNMCQQLRVVHVPAIKSQFFTFVKHVPQISETERETMFKEVNVEGVCRLTQIKQAAAKDRASTTLIHYVDNVMLMRRGKQRNRCDQPFIPIRRISLRESSRILHKI
ncbi:uncharacterized protein LOC143179149 [Calliopsis andreniformis]|uniref:uncharacterized protein LOC143179149 n=1 Tax=Calliopsis andreniformis TaxID=337506 RepID=UPI003FCEE2D2